MTTPRFLWPRRWLSTSLFILSGIATTVMLGFWFAGVWTHGHDASTRMAGTGFLACIVAVAFGAAGAGAWSKGR